MSSGGLRGVVNASLVKKFQALSSAGKSVAKSVSGGSSGASSVQLGLRAGAQTYAKAAQGFNVVAGYVNMAQGTLVKLQDLTDRMIAVCERASRSRGSQSSFRLQTQFTKLAKEFKQVVSDAEIKDRKFLTVDGLTELFSLIGLDAEKSDQIAKLFKTFWTVDSEGNLASEKIKEQASVPIPASVTGGPRSVKTVAYYLSSLSLDPSLQDWHDAEAVGISAGNSILEKDGRILVVSSDGERTEIVEAQQPLEMRAVDQGSGDFVVATRADLLGSNPAGALNLFLYNSEGQLQRQLTAINDPAVEIGAVGLSQDSGKYVVELKDSADGVPQIFAGNTNSGDAGINPEPLQIVDENEAGLISGYSSISISPDGKSVAYLGVTGTAQALFVKTVEGTDWRLAAQDPLAKQFGWLANDTLAIAQDSDSDGLADRLQKLSLSDGSSEMLQNGLQIDAFATIPAQTAAQGYMAVWDPAAFNGDTLRIITGQGKDYVSFLSFPAESSFKALNLYFNQDSLLELSMVANFDGDPANSSPYRILALEIEEVVRPFAAVTRKSEELFDGSRKLTNPVEAFSLMVDLKALRRQIDQNSEVLDQARDILIDHLALVRAAGNAFLDLSKEITSEVEADQLARQLQQQIRSNYRAAISHTSNLDSITAAALLLDDKSFS